MAHKYFEKKKIGDTEYMEFYPCQKMRLFAMTLYCDKEVSGNPEAVCIAAGIPINSYDKFCEIGGEWFLEWLDKRRFELGGKNKRAALEAVGMEKALAGDHQFWKPLAIREGVIQRDSVEIGINIPSSLPALKEMTDGEIAALENSVMASLRGETEPREIVMAEGPQGWERESDPG